MEAELIRTFRFEAAHALPHVPPGHKCRRIHGHGYRLDVHVTGEVDPEKGWVMDFADINRAVRPVLDELDHRLLGEVPGLENATAEVIARFLWDRLQPALPLLSAITVWESETNRCVYRGEAPA